MATETYKGATDDHRETQAPGLPAPRAGQSRGRGPARRAGLTRANLDRAIAELKRNEGIAIRTIAGINADGVFGSRRDGWRPDLPDACAEPFIPVLWLQVLELLGRVPKGSTSRFREDGTVPD